MLNALEKTAYKQVKAAIIADGGGRVFSSEIKNHGPIKGKLLSGAMGSLAKKGLVIKINQYPSEVVLNKKGRR